MSTANTTDAKFLKRFRMEIDLRNVELARPHLPDGYSWGAWHPAIIDQHAFAKHESFRTEMDCQIFVSLRTLKGCRDLMCSIMKHSGFLPQATWLIQFDGDDFRPAMPCGTIQGVAMSTTLGAIQNVGVIPEHRGFGLGRALVLKNLHAYRSCGLVRVYLDVSAENQGAIALYRSLGFKYSKTSYREIFAVD
ncbi:GNAT family N-acetyltransferase [Planctomicrobium sp.]|jgi:GNAT superfamily N-acetyltransferase|nr:GNAT family N-acetyltransferase [Planctomicrobium sp.]MDB4733601.1 GNAT family N-acetyltransferase [Planctomicrobium sp.]